MGKNKRLSPTNYANFVDSIGKGHCENSKDITEKSFWLQGGSALASKRMWEPLTC